MYKKLSQYAFATVALVSVSLFALVAFNLSPFAFAATSNQCLVTISGKQYDLTALSSTHSGPQGNTLNGGTGFFKCGTDMTASYQGMHGTNVSRIAQYLVVPTATPTAVPTAIPSPTSTVIPNPTSTIAPTSTPLPTVTVSPTGKPQPSVLPSICKTDDDESDDEDEDDDQQECEVEHKEKDHKENDHKKSDKKEHDKGSKESSEKED